MWREKEGSQELLFRCRERNTKRLRRGAIFGNRDGHRNEPTEHRQQTEPHPDFSQGPMIKTSPVAQQRRKKDDQSDDEQVEQVHARIIELWQMKLC